MDGTLSAATEPLALTATPPTVLVHAVVTAPSATAAHSASTGTSLVMAGV
jgi:hypothetical protein